MNDARQEASVAFPQLDHRGGVVSPSSWSSPGTRCPAVRPGSPTRLPKRLPVRNAKLELVKLQLEDRSALHIGHTQATVQRDATFNINTITLGGALVRNNLGIQLSEEHATAHPVWPLPCSRAISTSIITRWSITRCPTGSTMNCTKGTRSAVGRRFSGKILVLRDAQKTNAYQSNKNILPSDDAVMNAKPQLEIFADDVKCSRGGDHRTTRRRSAVLPALPRYQ